MSDDPLILGLPSKGRLMEHALKIFAAAGLTVTKTGHERGYRGVVDGVEGIEVAFLSASEIAHDLKHGRIHLGVTGEDLIREKIADADHRIDFLKPLDFGQADVIVAVPTCWIDVMVMADLEEAGAQFHRIHGRRMRVATKYMNLTRRFFARKSVSGYRIVESLGATEGTPAAGTAELIVDITSTGTTLTANYLKILKDGVILHSQANLVASRQAEWNDENQALRERVLEAVMSG